MNRVDLHTHSTASDGVRQPAELVNACAGSGIKVLSLTDHDTMEGIPEGFIAAQKAGIRMIPGVEFSVNLEEAGLSAHLLGYFPFSDPDQLLSKTSAFGKAISFVQDGRSRRNPRILKKLEEEGLHIAPETLEELAGGGVIGRPHIAQAMINAGYVSDTNEAFGRFLAKGRPAYIERDRLPVKAAIELIADSDGLPVMAHPGYIPLEPDELQSFFRRLRGYGLRGLEAYYPSHTKVLTELLEEIGSINELVLTGGTDYHGRKQDETPLGGTENGFHVTEEMVADFLSMCRT